MSKPNSDEYSEEEIASRLDRALKHALKTPATPHKPKARPSQKAHAKKTKHQSSDDAT